MSTLSPEHLHRNAPLYAVAAILVLAFAALALFGEARQPQALAQSSASAPLEALPATPEEEGAILSALGTGDAQARNAATPFADTDPAPARTWSAEVPRNANGRATVSRSPRWRRRARARPISAR